MGMAASQARFLTLTARKSNVEYEGQQVNQQRTSLANESSGLFNKMMALQVPTPPSATDFYNTRYTFEGTGLDYSITNFVPRTDGKYDLTIVYKGTSTVGRQFCSGNYTLNLDDENKPASCVMKFGSKDVTCALETLTRRQVKDENGQPVLDDNGNATYEYIAPDGTVDSNVNIVGEAAYPEKLSDDSNAVYYRFTQDNVNYYISGDNMAEAMKSQPATGEKSFTAPLTAYNTADQTVQKEAKAVGTFPKTTPEGRFEELQIESFTDCDDPKVIESLTGRFFDLSLTQVQDDEGYAEAMKDYEYQKMLYERTINDINAQTEIIQQQDRTLELRLKQLDTEQNALNTELEAVKKVIETNVEATFKTFA